MVRLLVTVVLGSALALGAAWYFDWLPRSDGSAPPGQLGGSSPHANTAAVAKGRFLYAPAAEAVQPPPPPHQPGPDPIVIPECFLQPVDTQTVASQKDGQLLFIGQKIEADEISNPLVQTFPVKIRVGDKEESFRYRELDRTALVRPGQLVALVDPTLALAELAGLRAKKVAAEADYKATVATYKEAQQKVNRLDNIKRAGTNIVSPEDYGGTVLMRDRYQEEMSSKREAIKLAQAEIDRAEAVERQYWVRNDMPSAGIIKAVFRKRGDTVRAQEPIMQLYSLERLRAEGMVDVQYLDRLQANPRVTLEPVIYEAPWRPFLGHRGEITSVACIGRGPALRVVSASEDKTVAVWDPGVRGGPVRILHHPEPVRVIACSPGASGHRWCLSGCADGSLRLWDLDGKGADPVWVEKDTDKGAYHGAVTALAFSPDGRFFASGGEDGMIHLWYTATGKLDYRFDAEHGVEHRHEGAVTALHFTPQCRLVSASRDNTLRVWTLKEAGAVMDTRVIANRGGTVSALGVTRDGGKMLFDQGRRLQVLSIPEGRTLSNVQGTIGSTPFETLALFSPDASLILTAGAPEGRMQLWRAPTAGERAYEVRQLATDEHAAVTCAAFAPDGAFAVSGTKDGTVYLWRMPSRAQVENHRINDLHLTQVDRALDANARQVRIGVNVTNQVNAQYPRGRLMPGRPVTVVIEP